MPEIDLGDKTDRDLLVVVVTTLNGMSEKLTEFCKRVESIAVDHARLRSEHDFHISQCEGPVLAGRDSTNKKVVAASAGAGGVIGAALTTLGNWLLQKMGTGG